jgi:hypothetical protein
MGGAQGGLPPFAPFDNAARDDELRGIAGPGRRSGRNRRFMGWRLEGVGHGAAGDRGARAIVSVPPFSGKAENLLFVRLTGSHLERR